MWEGRHINDKNVYTKVTSSIYNHSIVDIMRECEKKSSLRLLDTSQWSVPFYVSNCKRDARSGLLWFWLGGWRVYKHVSLINDIPSAECPLCFQEETATHILFQCKKTSELRTHISIPAELQENLQALHKSDSSLLLEQLGRYLNKVRSLRADALQKLSDRRRGVNNLLNTCHCIPDTVS
jgi:hypothetical protein